MHHRPWTLPAPVLAAALVVISLLGACGSDDRADITVTAADDSTTLDWRSSALVDVLANDSTSGGTLGLVSVEAPAHGTAVIEGGRLRYTPADGWFGQDSVRYTVQSDAGGATATATLAVAVQARLALSGTITDAPIADAAVTLRVGDETLEVAADPQGRYTAEVTSADPSAWVRIIGASPDGRVRLVSVVGALAGVAAQADAATGVVGAAELPALNATHWTSAEAALRARALGGALPASAQDMAATDAAVSASALQSLAIAVRLIADGGVPLPAGVDDSFALLLDHGAAQAFVSAQAIADPAGFAAAKQAVLETTPAPAGDPWAITDARTLAYTDGGNPMTGFDLTLALRPGGAATVHADGAAHAATWTADGAMLDVELATPVESIATACLNDPVTGACTEYAAAYRTLGYSVRVVGGGSANKRPVLLAVRVRHVWLDGPKAGETILETDSDDGYLTTLFDLAGRAGVAAGELAVGARLAGVASEDIDPTTGLTRDDILRIDGPGTGRFEVSGKTATWALEDGWLTVRAEGVVPRRYTRLERDPLTGLESWMTASVPADPDEPVVYTAEQELLFIDAGLAFTADSAARRWRTEGLVVSDPSTFGLEPSYVLNPDGSVTGFVQRWRVAADGTLELVRVYQGADYLRRWIPLRRVGDNLIVLEIIDWTYLSPGMIAWRINWQVDLGPAGG